MANIRSKPRGQFRWLSTIPDLQEEEEEEDKKEESGGGGIVLVALLKNHNK